MKAMADSLRPADSSGTAKGPRGEVVETTEDKYKNRLIAFVHEKQKDGRMGALVEGKLEAMYRAIHDINNAASDAAKRTIPRTYIEDLILHLYLLLGDLVVLAGDDKVIRGGEGGLPSGDAIAGVSLS